jgi:hypothetical protein
MTLLWLGDPHSFDVALVGGKATRLSRLASLQHRVPDGFCLPVTVLDQAHPLDLRDELVHALAALIACYFRFLHPWPGRPMASRVLPPAPLSLCSSGDQCKPFSGWERRTC